jgi:hypothetical protein
MLGIVVQPIDWPAVEVLGNLLGIDVIGTMDCSKIGSHGRKEPLLEPSSAVGAEFSPIDLLRRGDDLADDRLHVPVDRAVIHKTRP